MSSEKYSELFFRKPALIIDDQLNDLESDITRIKQDFEKHGLSFVLFDNVPDEKYWDCLGQLSFAILDWQLNNPNSPDGVLPSFGVSTLEDENKEFFVSFVISLIDKYMIPVFILTQQNRQHVEDFFRMDNKTKEAFAKGQLVVFSKSDVSGDRIEILLSEWCQNNPSVYVLKTFERAIDDAKQNLFSTMNSLNTNWPTIVYDTLKRDQSEDIDNEFVEFIASSLIGRINQPEFDKAILDKKDDSVSSEELIKIYSNSKFVEYTDSQPNNAYSGDLYADELKENFYLNITPECDIRRGKYIFIKGNFTNDYKYDETNGIINKNISHYVPLLLDKKCVEFCFRKYRVINNKKNFDEISFESDKNPYKRVGRLLHPYITEIRERFGYFISRHGHIRHPDQVLNNKNTNQD